MSNTDLTDEKYIQDKLANFSSSIGKIEEIIEKVINVDFYDKLEIKEKVDYDIFMTYTLNTLYWLYLRAKGIDPNQNEVKQELNRIKEYMVKAKQVRRI